MYLQKEFAVGIATHDGDSVLSFRTAHAEDEFLIHLNNQRVGVDLAYGFGSNLISTSHKIVNSFAICLHFCCFHWSLCKSIPLLPSDNNLNGRGQIGRVCSRKQIGGGFLQLRL